MYKRHLISMPIGIQHYVALRGFLSINQVNNEGARKFFSLFASLSVLLILIAAHQHVSSQSQLAQDAYAVFERSCLICREGLNKSH